MLTPLEVELPGELRRVLAIMAEAGMIGATAEEVAAYLIMRGVDDMMRAGVLKLGAEG